MDSNLLKPSIASLEDRVVFTLPDIVNRSSSDAIDIYNKNPNGEGKRFWTQVEDGEFDTDFYKITPISGKTNPQKYRKLLLDKPIIAPNVDASVRSVNEVLRPLGKVLAIVPLDIDATPQRTEP